VVRWLRGRLTYANVMATIAAFGVLAGAGAYAASKIGPHDIARNAVRSRHIKARNVRTSDLANGAVASAKVADDSLGPDKIVDPDRSVNLPLTSFVNRTDSTRLDFGPNPNDGTTPNFAIADNRLVIEWNDNSAGPADRDIVETTFTVPPDYVSGKDFALRISKDGNDDHERVGCAASVNDSGFSSTAFFGGTATITTAALATYTFTPNGGGFPSAGFSAGDTGTLLCFVDDGLSGTTAQDRVRLHSVEFLYKAAQ
jgi:hypothetical protein